MNEHSENIFFWMIIFLFIVHISDLDNTTTEQTQQRYHTLVQVIIFHVCIAMRWYIDICLHYEFIMDDWRHTRVMLTWQVDIKLGIISSPEQMKHRKLIVIMITSVFRNHCGTCRIPVGTIIHDKMSTWCKGKSSTKTLYKPLRVCILCIEPVHCNKIITLLKNFDRQKDAWLSKARL